MNRKIFIGVMVTAFVGIGAYLYASKAESSDMMTLSPRTGEITASSEFLNVKKSADYYSDQIRRFPKVPENYVRLAQIFMQEARTSGNEAEYFPKASALLNEALRRSPDHIEALATKASLLATLHRFDEAKPLAEKVISQNPHYSFAYGVLIDAQVEMGQYNEAIKTSDKLLGMRPDLRSYARASYLRELHGDLDGACEAMKMAADAGVPGQIERSWALYNLGNLYLSQGKVDTAAFIFRGILEERPGYAQASAGLAQVNYVKGNYSEAARLLKKAYEQLPEHGFREQLAEVYKAAGMKDEEESIAEEVVEIFGEDEEFGENVNRELAAFCLEHNVDIPEALQRAEKEYKKRPDNIHVLDTYAWALYKNGRYAEAARISGLANRLGTKDPMMLYRAGVIAGRSGHSQAAKEYMQKALTINPRLPVLYAREARNVVASAM